MRSLIAILVRAALFFGGLLACSLSSAASSLDKPKPIVADGASFTEPTGWVRLTPDKAKTKGWFISPDSNRSAPELMIMVDIGKPTDPTLRATAEGMARSWGGRVLDEKTSLDGVEALRVRVEKPGRGLRPVEGVVAMKEGRLYLLMGGAVPGRKVADQVEEVRKGWKWIK
jgi:hypothetical protein